MAYRSELTEKVKEASRRHLGYEIDRTELRLMPYIQYVMVNEQRIERDKINPYERTILAKWHEKGMISATLGDVTITKELWNAICEIVWLAYVDFENQ